MTERITIWVSKYALTDGIIKSDNVEVEDDIVWGPIPNCYFSRRMRHPDWHRTEAAAIARAEEMRAFKIASLEKQIAKLRAITFVEKGDE